MKYKFHTKIIAVLAGIIFPMMLARFAFAEVQAPVGASSIVDRDGLTQFLQEWSKNKDIRYIVSFPQLSLIEEPQAIVYLTDRGWCGSGGCTTLVLIHRDNIWRIVTKITNTRPPIRVLSGVSNGWHNIGVWVQGGGIKQGYEAKLIYNGKTYPTNATVSPAQRTDQNLPGEVVLSINPH